jgi:hypothetical protein
MRNGINGTVAQTEAVSEVKAEKLLQLHFLLRC